MKGKEKNFESSQSKSKDYIQGDFLKFSSETMESRKLETDIFKMLKEKKPKDIH